MFIPLYIWVQCLRRFFLTGYHSPLYLVKIYSKQATINQTHTMGYPDTFEGFQIEDQKKWTDFKKLPVRPSRKFMA